MWAVAGQPGAPLQPNPGPKFTLAQHCCCFTAKPLLCHKVPVGCQLLSATRNTYMYATLEQLLHTHPASRPTAFAAASLTIKTASTELHTPPVTPSVTKSLPVSTQGAGRGVEPRQMHFNLGTSGHHSSSLFTESQAAGPNHTHKIPTYTRATTANLAQYLACPSAVSAAQSARMFASGGIRTGDQCCCTIKGRRKSTHLPAARLLLAHHHLQAEGSTGLKQSHKQAASETMQGSTPTQQLYTSAQRGRADQGDSQCT